MLTKDDGSLCDSVFFLVFFLCVVSDVDSSFIYLLIQLLVLIYSL